MVLLFTNLLIQGKTNLSKVWLAAHWERKLKRYQIFQIDIVSSIQDMMSNEIILDLRLSGHLLVGIVRIFSRQTKYLLTDCSDIFSRVRVFHGNFADLTLSKMHAPLSEITIPEGILENLDDLEFGKIDEDALFVSNQSRVEEITLKETFLSNRLINDDDFDGGIFGEGSPISFDDDLRLLHEDIIGNVKLKDIDCDPGLCLPNEDLDLEDLNMEDMNGLIPCDHTEWPNHISTSCELIPAVIEIPPLKEKDKMELNLQPLPDSLEYKKCTRRKRKLIIDESKTLKKEKIDKQFKDTSDIEVPLELAPPSRRLMILKQIGEAEQLLQLPGQKFENSKILNLFKRNLKIQKIETFEDSSFEDGNNSFALSVELPRRDSNEFVAEDDLQSQTVNVCDIDFAEGIDGNEVQLNIQNFDSFSNNSYPHDSYQSFKQICLSKELQNDLTDSENISGSINLILQERILKLLRTLQVHFQENGSVKFSLLVKNDQRRKVAQKFLSLLMLKKFNILELKQLQAYEEILITEGMYFTSAYKELCKN